MKYIAYITLAVLLSINAKAQNIASYTAEGLMQRISNPDTFYVVNFWATWCGPCVKELPEFEKLQNMMTGKPVKIILVSMDFKEDYPKKILAFAKKKKLSHEIAWFNETDANKFIPKIDNRWQGSIPATMLKYKKIEYANFFEGTIKAEMIAPLIEKQLSFQ